MLKGWDKYKGEKDISACGLIAFINQDGERCSGEKIMTAMSFMGKDRMLVCGKGKKRCKNCLWT